MVRQSARLIAKNCQAGVPSTADSLATGLIRTTRITTFDSADNGDDLSPTASARASLQKDEHDGTLWTLARSHIAGGSHGDPRLWPDPQPVSWWTTKHVGDWPPSAFEDPGRVSGYGGEYYTTWKATTSDGIKFQMSYTENAQRPDLLKEKPVFNSATSPGSEEVTITIPFHLRSVLDIQNEIKAQLPEDFWNKWHHYEGGSTTGGWVIIRRMIFVLRESRGYLVV